MAMARGMEWAAPSGAGFGTSSTGQISLAWLLRTTLSFCFLTAFLEYEVSSSIALYVPVAIFAFGGLLVLCGRQRTDRVQHVLSGGGLWFAAVLFGEVVSYTSRDLYSVSYGLLFVVVFLCARLIVQEIGVPNVVRAYSQAGIVTVCVVLLSGRHTLFAGASGRFNGGTRAHPNLVGFILAGYFPLIVWRAMEEKVRWKKRVLIGLSIATFGLIFITGSRGSLSAVLAATGALLLRGMSSGWLQKLRIRHLHIILILLAIPLMLFFLLQHNRIGRAGDFISDFLALTSSQRGLKSGLSGRTNIWEIAFRLLRTHNRWLFGFGYRAGDRMVGTIDNGYIQLLFESGLIAGLMIFGSMLRVFYLLWQASRPRENNAWTRYYMVLWCLMIVYFLNNISARYLFSFGSPFSLCVLCLMAASRQELVGGGMHMRVMQEVKPPPRATRKTLLWNRSAR
jgi:O-antigen ligase